MEELDKKYQLKKWGPTYSDESMRALDNKQPVEIEAQRDNRSFLDALMTTWVFQSMPKFTEISTLVYEFIKTGAVGGGGESSAGSLLKLMFSVITFFAIMLVKVAGKVIKFYAKLYFINIFYNIFFVNNVGYIFSFFGFDPIFSPIEISPNPFVLFDYALNNVGVLINIFLAFSPLVRVFFGFFMNSTLQFLITVPNIFVVILSFLDGHAVSALYREVGVFDSFWTITPFYSSMCFVILSLFLYGIRKSEYVKKFPTINNLVGEENRKLLSLNSRFKEQNFFHSLVGGNYFIPLTIKESVANNALRVLPTYENTEELIDKSIKTGIRTIVLMFLSAVVYSYMINSGYLYKRQDIRLVKINAVEMININCAGYGLLQSDDKNISQKIKNHIKSKYYLGGFSYEMASAVSGLFGSDYNQKCVDIQKKAMMANIKDCNVVDNPYGDNLNHVDKVKIRNACLIFKNRLDQRRVIIDEIKVIDSEIGRYKKEFDLIKGVETEQVKKDVEVIKKPVEVKEI